MYVELQDAEGVLEKPGERVAFDLAQLWEEYALDLVSRILHYIFECCRRGESCEK